MPTLLYFGSLPYSLSDVDLESLVRSVLAKTNRIWRGKDPVIKARIAVDNEGGRGRSRGFGFVEVDLSDEEVDRTVELLNGSQVGNRILTVNRARPMERRRLPLMTQYPNEWAQQCQLLVPDFSKIDEELAAYLDKHPDALERLGWRQFELFMGDVFRNQGFDVEVGPGRGDQGVDLRLLMKDSIGSLLTLAQLKKYKQGCKIKLEPVAALHGILDDHGAHRGLFVTTSSYLPSARRFAEMRTHRLELADGDDVLRWIKEIATRNKAAP